MDDLAAIRERNKAVAQRINDEALRDPTSPYAGKFVGIANGQVVVVADDLGTMARRLREIEPDSRRTFWVDAGHDPSLVEYV